MNADQQKRISHELTQRTRIIFWVLTAIPSPFFDLRSSAFICG